jgi:hypothetical protein
MTGGLPESILSVTAFSLGRVTGEPYAESGVSGSCGGVLFDKSKDKKNN